MLASSIRSHWTTTVWIWASHLARHDQRPSGQVHIPSTFVARVTASDHVDRHGYMYLLGSLMDPCTTHRSVTIARVDGVQWYWSVGRCTNHGTLQVGVQNNVLAYSPREHMR